MAVALDAFDELYEAHAGRAMRLALAMTGDRHRAEDVVAEAFARVLPRWRRGGVDEFWPYLRTAVVNGFRGTLRRRLEPSLDLLPAAPSGAPDLAGPVTDRQALLAALAALPAGPRAAIALRYLEDLSEHDTAAVLGWPVGTVKSTVSRGLVRLRDLLAEEDP